jgi:hypothetical protein
MRAICIGIVLLLIATYCRAQQGTGSTVVFKVRTPKNTVGIYTEDSLFWLEKDNLLRVKSGNAADEFAVTVIGGKVKKQEGNNFYLFFTRPGLVAVKVYKKTKRGNILLNTKNYEVRSPLFYFCGVKLNTASYKINLNGDNLYAWSEYYKCKMPVKSFSMYYIEDTNRVAVRYDGRKIEPEFYKTDSCMLTPAMRKRLLKFQPNYNYIYFYDIVCQVPDGSKRLLLPVNLGVTEDTVYKKEMRLLYSIAIKK